MNIICDKTLLSAAIDGVSRAVTPRSTTPALEGILLKAEGFNLTLTGYDMELGIVTTIEANVLEAGDIVLNAKLLNDMVRRMPAGQISISVADNGKTTIQGGVAQFEIQSMPAADFPQLPNTGAEDTLTIKTGMFREMIERTLYAVSQDEKRPAHTGELFEIQPDRLTVVALDGFRLAIVDRKVQANKEIRIIVPGKTMNDERASLIITERLKNPLRITFTDGKVIVRCQTSLGRVMDEFAAACEGDEVEIGFNNRYLLDALRNARTEQVRVQLSGPLSPVKILPAEGDDFLYLVLPVRFRND